MNESKRVSLTSILEELSDESLQRLPRRMSALLSDALGKPNRDAWRFSKLNAASDELARAFIQVCTSNAAVPRTREPNAGWPADAILGTVPFYGILDKSGCWVVKPELEGLDSFEQGLACAKQGGCWGSLDREGNWALSPQFDYLDHAYAPSGVVLARQDGNWGSLDLQGKWIFRSQFSNLQPWHCACCQAVRPMGREPMILATSWGMQGVVDPHGKVLVPFQFDELGPLHDANQATTAREGGAWGVIDLTGKWILAPQFEDACLYGDRLLASIGGRWGMLDLDGRWITEPVFDSISFVGDRFEYFSIRWGEQVGVVDNSGRRVVEPQFEDVEEWEGVLQAQEDGRWGFLDERGTWQVEPCFDSCCMFRDGLAPARRVDQKLFGIVDRSGEWVVPPRFTGLRRFEDGLASAAEGDSPTSRWGFINREGNWAIPPVFAWVEDFSDGLAHACQADDQGHATGRQHGFINHRGEWVFKLDSNHVPEYFEDGLAQVRVQEPPLILYPEVRDVFCDPRSGEVIVEFAAPS